MLAESNIDWTEDSRHFVKVTTADAKLPSAVVADAFTRLIKQLQSV